MLKAQWWWLQGDPCSHRDVSLPHWWHLNRGRLPVRPPITHRRALCQEMQRRIKQLPPALQ
jgi:hypothetical protein